jgi:ABC-2 type transport system permease protein
MAIALIFTQEFEKGTFAELITRTKSSTLMIFGKATPYLLYMIAIWAVILYIVFPIFKIEVIGAFGNVALVSLLFMLSLLAFGIMVSVFCRTQLLATDILMIISAPSFIISGYTWPLSQMPGFMQYLANILPLTHFLSAFRKVVFVGVSWQDVKPELQALLILALVYGILAIAVLKIKIYLEAKKSSAVSISQDLPASK